MEDFRNMSFLNIPSLIFILWVWILLILKIVFNYSHQEWGRKWPVLLDNSSVRLLNSCGASLADTVTVTKRRKRQSLKFFLQAFSYLDCRIMWPFGLGVILWYCCHRQTRIYKLSLKKKNYLKNSTPLLYLHPSLSLSPYLDKWTFLQDNEDSISQCCEFIKWNNIKEWYLVSRYPKYGDLLFTLLSEDF